MVALDADTGRYVWHYQTTPADSWDYDSSTDMTLATLKIDGRERKVILHAAKNGFFYVIDRESGRLLSARQTRYGHLGGAGRPRDGSVARRLRLGRSRRGGGGIQECILDAC